MWKWMQKNWKVFLYAAIDVAYHICIEPIFCPHANGAQASLQMKCLLQHQPWSLAYNIEPDELVCLHP